MADYLLPSAFAFYSTLPDGGLSLMRSVGGWLLTKAPQRFTSANVQQGVAHCARKPLQFIREALDPFVTGGWLEPETEYPNNRAWTLVEGVRDAFAQRTRTERERKAALYAALGGAKGGS